MPATLATNPWPTWSDSLGKFAEASALMVSAWDTAGERRVGPLGGSRFTQSLAESDGWRGGAAEGFERELAVETIRLNAGQSALFADQLRVRSIPLRQFGVAYGAVVFGWVLADFATNTGAERLAKLVKLSSRAIWSLARLETPVSVARMAHHAALLETLTDAITRAAESISQLEEQRATRALFLSHAAHELRTPLHAISMRVELLLQGPLDNSGPTRAALEKVRRYVYDESRLVDDLLEAAVTSTGRFPLRLVKTDVNEVVRAAYDIVVPVAETKGVNLMIEQQDGEQPLCVDADAHRLQQAVWNLVSNAVKFTPPAANVLLRSCRIDDGVEVEVRDSGPGIDEALLPRLFDPFTRRKDRNSTGLGLGLSIARQIVKLHGGDISVQTRPTIDGTSFRIHLPLSGAPAPGGGTIERAPSHES